MCPKVTHISRFSRFDIQFFPEIYAVFVRYIFTVEKSDNPIAARQFPNPSGTVFALDILG